MNKILILIVSMFLIGCGSDSSKTPSLSDLAGVYDLTTNIGQEIDERYWVIRANGSYTVYDYDGDSYDQGSNCYFTFAGTIVDSGNGDFTILNGSSPKIELVNGSIKVTVGVNIETYPSLSLQESDFSPICSSLSENTAVRKYSDKQIKNWAH